VSDGEDLVSRARSIFARLRDDVEDEREGPAAEPSANGLGETAEPEAEPVPVFEDEPGDAPAEVAEVVETSGVEEEPVDEAAPDLRTVDAVVETPETPAQPLVQEGPALPERLVEPDEIPETVTAAPEAPAPSAPGRALPRVIAVANQKGGVGKTTTAVNLGAALAELGYRVLVVDLDPQGNATTGLGINPRNVESSIYDVVMNGSPIEDAVEPTAVRNLFVVPATIDLAGAEIELVPAFSRELKLRRALEDATGDFDFTLIDCPPSLGLLTVNGLAAATEVLVPIQCEYYALEGLGQLLKNVSLVQTNLNPRLELSAIVLTMYDARTRLAEQVAKEVRDHFGDTVCRSIVPRTVRLSEAPSFGQPVIVFDSSSRGALAYRELAKEVSGGTPQRTG
jgi:chromosome partitioning protein